MRSIQKVNMSKSITYFLCLLILSNCSIRRQISNCLNKKKYSISYLHDKPINNQKKSISIGFDSVTIKYNSISQPTKVNIEKRRILPFLIFNSWYTRFNCVQGGAAIRENLSTFIRSQIESEIIRSTNYLIKSKDSADYVLSMEVDTIYANSHIIYGGFTLFIIYGIYSNPTDISSIVGINYKLINSKTKDTILSNKTIATEYVDKTNKEDYYLNNIYAGNYYYILGNVMSDALSRNIKTDIENIIKDIDKKIALK